MNIDHLVPAYVSLDLPDAERVAKWKALRMSLPLSAAGPA